MPKNCYSLDINFIFYCSAPLCTLKTAWQPLCLAGWQIKSRKAYKIQNAKFKIQIKILRCLCSMFPAPLLHGCWLFQHVQIGRGVGGEQLGWRRIAAAKIARKSEKTSERCLCANNIPQRTLLNYMILTVKQPLPTLPPSPKLLYKT